MSALTENRTAESRRHFFQSSTTGLGSIALGSLLVRDLPAELDQHDARSSVERLSSGSAGARQDHRPRAKHVIFIHLVGAPSQLELFDYKPQLQRRDGQLVPDELWNGLRLAFIRKQPRLLGTRARFSRHGESGMEISDYLPCLARESDELCLIRSLRTDQFNHAPAQLMLQSGSGQFGRPSVGAWVNYGLGRENQNLPGFVVLITGSVAGAGNSLWGSGFLPSRHQGIEFRTSGDPVLFLSNPEGIDARGREQIIRGINRLNRVQLADVGDPEIASRISQYELAYRMQMAVPELMDLHEESKATHDLYGTDPGRSSFANNCLLARRLVERGVQFVQLYDEGWDHHSGVFPNLKRKCKEVDRPIAALIADLRQRGMLDDTLVIWGAEFGRTPMVQGTENTGRASDNMGRDHHRDAFSMWMAGGGVRGGLTWGETDDIGFRIVENPVHVHDFHATLLHLLGLDHEQLTFRYQGRNFRLTDVAGRVVTEIMV